MKARYWAIGVLWAGATLAGCASNVSAPVEQRMPGKPGAATASPVVAAPAAPAAPASPAPVASPVSAPAAPVVAPLPPSTTAPSVPAAPVAARPIDNRALLWRLIPARTADRNGWGEDIYKAFSTLKLDQTAENYCAAIAVIEQLSSWQADPVVPDLGDKVWQEVGNRAAKYHIPLFTVKAALAIPSLDGRSYKARIDALKTERQMNDLFEAIVAEAPDVARRLGINNPIRTGGPMQVSVEFANSHVHTQPYPYPIKGSLRSEVFTRHGGVYFGVAHLLQYPAPYKAMIYRFADYNAGRYSSRNAAFQLAVARLTGARIAPDGDVLIYQNGRPAPEQSLTARSLLAAAGKLGLTAADINADLAQEKAAGFEQTRTYQRVFALADKAAGRPLAREALPQIHLQSVKISHKLTTEWFAEHVDAHYQQCLARQ